MPKHLGSSIALVLGVLAVIAGLASAYRGLGTGAGDVIVSGPIIVLGALAYRSAKKRMLGQVAPTWVRKAGEAVAIVLIFVLILPLDNLRLLLVTQPVHYILIPAWAVVAYALVAFREPRILETLKQQIAEFD